jgi:peptidase E
VAVRQAAEAGIPYLAASAGAELACPAIRTTNDMPIAGQRPGEDTRHCASAAHW